ncbi:serine hydrolase [Nesterenkonia sp. F]|uniref:serine hydrolase domain-containing protein n=1 Tax=Nesterenkonia sp. F TaxID=795955 RepID=UPI000255CE65|nr:serine hydrolase domain-containing protein [Nesterenkonia sp. F]
MTVALACAVLGAVVATLLAPGAGAIDRDSPVHGDRSLAAAAVEELDGAPVHALSVAEVTSQGTRTATVDAPLHGTVEIGSVSKALTGMLYEDMVADDEISPDQRLGTLLDLGDAPAADVTLEQLAQHRSGLPRLNMGVSAMARMLASQLLATSPYDATVQDVVDDVRDADLDADRPQYSNLGFAALGHALAAAAGTDYPALVRDRLAEPLDLETLRIPDGPEDLGERAVPGVDANGRPQQSWADVGYAAAGGIRADAATMAQLARALLDGTAPGMAALEPTEEFTDDDRIGAGWLVSKDDGRTITWHDGGTGGFRTWFGLDRERGTAVFLSGATTADLDAVGQALLHEAGEEQAS